jgi:hypothetical protein
MFRVIYKNRKCQTKGETDSKKQGKQDCLPSAQPGKKNSTSP